MLEAFQQARQQWVASGLPEADLPFLMYQPEFRTGCLLLHGSAASPCNSRPLAQHLFGSGYSVMAPLLAGHADLAALYAGHTTWLDCFQTAAEALLALKSVCEQVYVIGSSFGGTLAYLLGVEYPEQLAGVVALSAPVLSQARWQPEQPWMQQIKAATAAAEYHLPALQVPTLVMHGQDDSHVRVENALSAYARMPSRRKKLVLYNGIGHALGFGFNTAEVAQDIGLFMAYNQAFQSVQLRVPDRAYQSLHLSGEFNSWRADDLPFVREQAHWQITLALQPGIYQYKLVIDGQHWIVDPEAESIQTPHGDRNSLLRVRDCG